MSRPARPNRPATLELRPALLVVLSLVLIAPTHGAAPATEPESQSAAARANLARRLPEVKFDGVNLDDTIDFLRDYL